MHEQGSAIEDPFQSTPSVGRATQTALDALLKFLFQSTPSVGRATGRERISLAHAMYFNPRPPWGGRPVLRRELRWMGYNFNPRPPWGGRHYFRDGVGYLEAFQSTPSVGRATTTSRPRRQGGEFQSTPSVGRATHRDGTAQGRRQHFNPRPPWGGRHACPKAKINLYIFQSTPSVGRATLLRSDGEKSRKPFQSTPSVGRATADSRRHVAPSFHFNPRPPWGGRLDFRCRLVTAREFQSTPSVGRATLQILPDLSRKWTFQSTPSVGRATLQILPDLSRKWTFQSTPSVGRATLQILPDLSRKWTFQSTPSVGRATLQILPDLSRKWTFQSTPSVGRATLQILPDLSRKWTFQSTPSVGRATLQILPDLSRKWTFQSTPSVGRATQSDKLYVLRISFQSTPSVGRATFIAGYDIILCGISIHALRGEGDRHGMSTALWCKYFNPRPPWGGRHD